MGAYADEIQSAADNLKDQERQHQSHHFAKAAKWVHTT